MKNVTIKTARITGANRIEGRKIGLGDVVAAIATPIARKLGLPCVDPNTKGLRPESGCARRKAILNAAVPNLLRKSNSNLEEPTHGPKNPI